MSQYDFVKGSICVSVKLSTVVAVEVYGVVVCVSGCYGLSGVSKPEFKIGTSQWLYAVCSVSRLPSFA